jgi:hypothetical protein
MLAIIQFFGPFSGFREFDPHFPGISMYLRLQRNERVQLRLNP